MTEAKSYAGPNTRPSPSISLSLSWPTCWCGLVQDSLRRPKAPKSALSTRGPPSLKRVGGREGGEAKAQKPLYPVCSMRSSVCAQFVRSFVRPLAQLLLEIETRCFLFFFIFFSGFFFHLVFANRVNVMLHTDKKPTTQKRSSLAKVHLIAPPMHRSSQPGCIYLSTTSFILPSYPLLPLFFFPSFVAVSFFPP